jgi:hypothetical protein
VIGQRLLHLPCPIRSHPRAHHGQRAFGGKHVVMPGPRVVSMGVADDGVRDRAERIDIKSTGLAEEPIREGFQPGLGMRAGHMAAMVSNGVSPVKQTRKIIRFFARSKGSFFAPAKVSQAPRGAAVKDLPPQAAHRTAMRPSQA